MSDADLGPWKPLDVHGATELFAAAPFRWWISGGLALELHVGRTWRTHGDIDVGMMRSDLATAYEYLAAWDLHVAAAGLLTPWHGQPLSAERHQNNIWCRPAPDTAWALDLTVGDGSSTSWIYRRNPDITMPWDVAVRHTADGIPYLAPELQLLFKSKGPRPKDHLDAAEVLPELGDDQQDRLHRWLLVDHPWRALF